MELKDFIKETLIQIVDGIKDSQSVMKEKGALISPEGYTYKGKGSCGDFTCVECIDFEVTIEAKEGNNSNGGIKTPIIEVLVGKSSNSGSYNKVSFSIPIVYPRMETKEFKSF